MFSADSSTPSKLAAEKAAVAASQITYAQGQLLLWSAQPGYVDGAGAVLKTGTWKHLALANPKLAPYGAAGQEVLQQAASGKKRTSGKRQQALEPNGDSAMDERPAQEESRWNKVVSSVRGWFGGEDEADAPPVAPPTSTVKVNCRVVPVEREFQRPIAYDVDYIYKGVKYRSRLAEDPGNPLRIRISVVPYVAPAQATASGP